MKKFIKVLIGIILVCGMLFLYYSKNSLSELFFGNSQKTTSVNKKTIKIRDGIRGVVQPNPFIVTEGEINRNLLENSNNNLVGQLIYTRKNELPEAQQKLLANNKDTTQYILGYLTGERVPFEYGETAELERKYPYYIQWDRRWAYDELGDIDVAIGGCGPTSVAMAIGGLLNDKTITPRKIAEIENKNGYFTSHGTSWNFFDFIAKEYGLKSNQVYLSKENIDKVLKQGNPIIMSVKPGKFTTVGHIILVVAKDKDGNYIINDPNSYTRTLKTWSYNELKTEIVAMWEFSK
ncbi:murein hydrolase [Gemella sp. oral taxon 928]|uniref:C39 family peptidase n=1 Tax=unclassified Gemella TaxID=2624949 RepID=UPI0007681564|nr:MULTISPECIES: C39 family peptidase [unclassified Gemella]AME09613.1 murein hydrolase [Gemella sp. oral taxon 928]AXI27216.1 murein hydrolase [Gemella sp. ND 6198]